MFKTIKNCWQQRVLERKNHISINQSQTEIIKSSLSVSFVFIMFLVTYAILVNYIFYDKALISSIDPYFIAIFYGGLSGMYIYKNINSYFGNSQEKKLTSVDTLNMHLKNSKYNISDATFKKLDEYYAEADKNKKNKLFKNLSKEIDLEISCQENKNFDQNQKTTYLKVIGVLIDIIKTKEVYKIQSHLTEEIIYSYEGEKGVEAERGLSIRNLDSIYSEANSLLSIARKRKTEHKN